MQVTIKNDNFQPIEAHIPRPQCNVRILHNMHKFARTEKTCNHKCSCCAQKGSETAATPSHMVTTRSKSSSAPTPCCCRHASFRLTGLRFAVSHDLGAQPLQNSVPGSQLPQLLSAPTPPEQNAQSRSALAPKAPPLLDACMVLRGPLSYAVPA